MTEAHDDHEQLLHIVIGGELRHLDQPVFRDLSKVEFVGALPTTATGKIQRFKLRERGAEGQAQRRAGPLDRT